MVLYRDTANATGRGFEDAFHSTTEVAISLLNKVTILYGR